MSDNKVESNLKKAREQVNYAQSENLAHDGFASAALAGWGYLYNTYPQHFKLPENKDTIYWINGHSLGGSIAELFALNLRQQGVPANHIICYGIASAPVGNKALANYAWNPLGMGDRIYKVMNEGDIVPTAGLISYTLAVAQPHLIHEKTTPSQTIFYHLNGYKPRLRFEAWQVKPRIRESLFSYRGVKLGMSQAKVKSLLGDPIDPTPHVLTDADVDDDKFIGYTMCSYYIENTGVVVVFFDKSDKAQDIVCDSLSGISIGDVVSKVIDTFGQGQMVKDLGDNEDFALRYTKGMEEVYFSITNAEVSGIDIGSPVTGVAIQG